MLRKADIIFKQKIGDNIIQSITVYVMDCGLENNIGYPRKIDR